MRAWHGQRPAHLLVSAALREEAAILIQKEQELKSKNTREGELRESSIRSVQAPTMRLLAVAIENHTPHPLRDVAKQRVMGALEADSSPNVSS